MLTQTDQTSAVAGADATRVPPSAEVQTANIRAALEERLGELRAEHAELMVGLSTEVRGTLVPDAGDDVVDIGNKAFIREQEMSLAHGVLDRIDQVERALGRLAAGDYGYCEGCGEPIAPARLAAFPSVTQCVSCKQRAERR